MDNNSTFPCKCEESPLLDKYHNHIDNKQFKNITNNEFRTLFSKGPKYQENRAADYEKAKESIITGKESCIQPWGNKHGVATLSFSF